MLTMRGSELDYLSGSTVLMTEGLGTVTDRYDYDAWGNEYPIEVSTSDNPYRYVGQLGYYTHWMDSSLSDLLHLGIRFYEPGAGRFSQRDPIHRELGPFLYANNTPVTAVDPDGALCYIYTAKGTRKTEQMNLKSNQRKYYQHGVYVIRNTCGKSLPRELVIYCEGKIKGIGLATHWSGPGRFFWDLDELTCYSRGVRLPAKELLKYTAPPWFGETVPPPPPGWRTKTTLDLTVTFEVWSDCPPVVRN